MRSIGQVGYWSGLAACGATVAFVVVQLLQLMGALHHMTRREMQFWTHASICFTIVYAVFVTANYVVQLATVIPAKLAGTSEAIRILEQTPHSMFWDYDAVGYISMGLACLLVIPAFDQVGFERWVRWSLGANALVTPLIGIVYFYPRSPRRCCSWGSPGRLRHPFSCSWLP